MSITGKTAKTKRKKRAGPNSLKAEPLELRDLLPLRFDCPRPSGLTGTGTGATTGSCSAGGRRTLARLSLSQSKKAFNASTVVLIYKPTRFNKERSYINIPDLK
jgi:hypothetical protein